VEEQIPDRNPVATRSRIRPSISALVSTTKIFSGAPGGSGLQADQTEQLLVLRPTDPEPGEGERDVRERHAGPRHERRQPEDRGRRAAAATARPAIRPPTPATISAAGTLRSSSSIERTAVAVCRPSTPPRTNPVDVPRTT
jgi:hypothetical protein